MSDIQLKNPRLNDDLESSLADLQATREKETSQTWVQQAEKSLALTIGGAAGANKSSTEPSSTALWIAKLPANITTGLIDAAVNTADAIKAFHEASDYSLTLTGSTKPEQVGAKSATPEAPAEPKAPPESPIYNSAKQAVMNFRDYLSKDSGTSDEVTQSIAQYAIPFMGWSKFIGGLHSATTLGTIARAGVAEALTASTVLAPHDPRAADILQLGKHVEGKFGDAMNTIAPDGSLFNSYINYMTDRSNESDAEGRFKNVVDNLALSSAAAGLIKTTAMTLKGGFATAKYALEAAGTGPTIGSKASQGGKLDAFGQRVVNPPVTHAIDETGAHTFESPSGGLIALESDKALRVKYIQVKEGAQGEGEGQAMMREAFDKAQARGKVLQSDFSVSPSQQHVYGKLEKAGYTVVRNPAHVDPLTGNLVTDKAGVPVFEITDKPAIPERRQEINKQMRAKAELAPPKGAGVVQTGKDHWTVFVDRKPQGSYGTEARAKEELDALNGLEKK